MENVYNPNGSRNKSYRPYIAFEETTYDTSIYDPSRSVIYGLYRFGVTPGAITTQENLEEYRLLRDNSGAILQANPVSRTYADIATYPPNLVRSVYTYHTGATGNSTAYKNLYAM